MFPVTSKPLQAKTIENRSVQNQKSLPTKPDSLRAIEPIHHIDSRLIGLFQRQSMDYSCHHINLNHWPKTYPLFRATLARWALNVNKTFKQDPSLVSVAMGILDKYLACSESKANDCLEHFHKSILVAFNLAIKTRGLLAGQISMASLANLSPYCSKEDLIKHEMVMLEALQWHLNVITPEDFIAQFLQLLKLPPQLNDQVSKLASELSRYSLEDHEMICDNPLFRNNLEAKKIQFEASDIALVAIHQSLHILTDQYDLTMQKLISDYALNDKDQLTHLGNHMINYLVELYL